MVGYDCYVEGKVCLACDDGSPDHFGSFHPPSLPTSIQQVPSRPPHLALANSGYIAYVLVPPSNKKKSTVGLVV